MKINFTLERCRLLYNRLLEERILTYETEGKGLNYYDQTKTFSERKKHIPALKQVHSQVLQDVARRLDKAFQQTFFRRLKQGGKARFPNFKARQRYNSFTYPQSGYSINGNRIYLSMIGNVKIKLHRNLQGKMKTCTIVVRNDKYYACISCEVQNRPLSLSEDCVRVDSNFVELVSSEVYEVSTQIRKNKKRLEELRGAISRKKTGSNRRKKAILNQSQIYEKMANQQKDFAHKLSRQLVNHYGLITFDNLNSLNNENSQLSDTNADVSWNQLIQFTNYKAEIAGRVIVYADAKNLSRK